MFNTSTQKNFWLFESREKIDNLRTAARDNFVNKLGPHDRRTCLTADEEKKLQQLVIETAQKFCETFDPPMPPSVAYVGFTYFKRIYLNNSVMEYLAKNVMMACLYLASKIDEFNVSIDDFVSNLKSGTRDSNTEVILGMEAQLMRLLRFHLTIHGPYRPFEGHLIEIKTKWPKIQRAEVLRKKSEEFLWKSMLSDAGFLFAPSQIALAAILYSSRELGYDLESYIQQCLCQNDQIHFEKLMAKLNACIDMVNSIAPIPMAEAAKLQEKVKNCVVLLSQKQMKRRSEDNPEPSLAAKRTKQKADSDLDE